MSILETFYILFKSDSSSVKKGSEEAKKSTDDLQDSLEKTDSASMRVGESFLGLAKSFSGLIAGFFTATAAVAGLKEAADYAYNLNLSSQALNVNAQALAEWGGAVRQTGGNLKSFEESIKTLSTNLGVMPKVAMQFLPQLADAFQRMGRFTSTRYGKMLGLDEPTILLLQKGRKEVEAIIKKQQELGVATKGQIEASDKFTVALQNTGTAWREVFLSVGETVLPVLTKALEAFTNFAEYLQKHSQLVIGALIGIGAAATIAAIPFIILNLDIIAITAGVALLISAFAVLYDDVQSFLHGQDSILGRIIERWPLVGRIVNTVLGSWKTALNSILDSLFPFLRTLEQIYSFFSGDKKIKTSVDLKAEANKPGQEKPKLNVGLSEDYLGLNENTKFKNTLQKGQENLSLASNNSLGSQTSNSILNSRSVAGQNTISIGDITINTQATDAEGIGSSLTDVIKSHFSSHFWQANSQVDDGVVA